MANDGTWLMRTQTGRAKKSEDSNFGDGFLIDNVGFIHVLLQKGKSPEEIKVKLREHAYPIYNGALFAALDQMNWTQEKREAFATEFYSKSKRK